MRRILLYLSIILLGVCATAAAGWCAEIVEVKILLNGDPVQDVSGYFRCVRHLRTPRAGRGGTPTHRQTAA